MRIFGRDRPIFFTIFKHFTIIGYRFKKKKVNFFCHIYLFYTYTIIQSITSSEMCSLYLTHPSTHTPGAVERHTHTHTHTWSSGHTHTHMEQRTHTHLEQWTHTHTHGAKDTHTHTHTHTRSSGDTHTHTHTHMEQRTHTHTWSSGHTHTHGAKDTHKHTHTHTHTLGAVGTVHSGEAPARPPHVTLYKIHSFETR